MPRLSSAATSLSVVLVGVGLERDRLQAQDLGVSDQLQCLGFRSDPERFLAEAAVFVLPSRFEGMPNALLEAMAAGIPSLAFHKRQSGMGWVGQLEQFPWSQQPAALADVLRQLQSDPEQRAALGRQSRQRYRSLFQRSVWLQQLEQWQSVR